MIELEEFVKLKRFKKRESVGSEVYLDLRYKRVVFKADVRRRIKDWGWVEVYYKREGNELTVVFVKSKEGERDAYKVITGKSGLISVAANSLMRVTGLTGLKKKYLEAKEIEFVEDDVLMVKFDLGGEEDA